MKYLTKRQRKRKKVQIFNRIGYYHTDSESEPAIDLIMESDIEVDGLEMLNNKKVPIKSMSMQMPLSTKGIDKGGIKSKQPQQQQQQQHQQEGTATACDNRRYNFGFGPYPFPPIDYDLECYYHRNIPLTLGSFMDLNQLSGRQGQRSKSTSTPQTSPSISSAASEQPLELTMSSSNDSVPGVFVDNDDKGQQDESADNVNLTVNDLLTRFAINTSYQDLKTITLAMLKNTAFGPLNIDTASTIDNVPSFEFWPTPYQINILQKEEVVQDSKRLEPTPECSVKPIGYEAKCKHISDVRRRSETKDMWLSWQNQNQIGNNKNNTFEQNNNHMAHIAPNSMSIVDSIKCIWKRNVQPNNSDVNMINWGNGKNGSIWSVVDPQRQQQLNKISWDQRSRALVNANCYGNYTPTIPLETIAGLEYQQHSKGITVPTAAEAAVAAATAATAPTAPTAVTSNSGNYYANRANQSNKPLQFYNRNVDYYNARLANSRMQHQQQQFLDQQQQLQSVRFYPNQQQQQQHWQWQQYRQPKPRPQFNAARYYKNNYYNSNNSNNNNCNNNCHSNNNNTNNAFHRFCKLCNSNVRYNSNNNSNMDQLLLNMSQDDLDATQMYAIHGERFFEMPLGRRYRRSLYPMTAPTLPPQPPPPLPRPPPLTTPPKTSPSDLYLANVHLNNWQANFMPQYPTPVETAPPTPQSQVTVSDCADLNQYTANFPPLPAPNQRRVGQSQKD